LASGFGEWYRLIRLSVAPDRPPKPYQVEPPQQAEPG
jgi:hypothetical protein